ncbi:unnamed protein product, partial [Symbiodinium sp. KB8]
MQPSKPPDVTDEDWELELPSILGSAHPDFHGPAETPSPRSLISVESDRSSLQSTVLYAEDTPPHMLRLTQADTDTSADTPFLEWNIPASHTELTLDGSALTSLPSPLEQDPTAEHLAHFFIQTGKASFRDISRLLDLLPEKTSARRRGPLCLDGVNRKCFSTGAFTFSHSTGVQSNVTLYPRVTAALAGIMRGMCPEAVFASLTLQRNIQLQCHRDIGNEPGLMNTVVPCSRWVGGCLWLQSAGGVASSGTHNSCVLPKCSRRHNVSLTQSLSQRLDSLAAGKIKLNRNGWLISQHPQYGELLHALSNDKVKKMFEAETFGKLPVVKEQGTTSNRKPLADDTVGNPDGGVPGAA